MASEQTNVGGHYGGTVGKWVALETRVQRDVGGQREGTEWREWPARTVRTERRGYVTAEAEARAGGCSGSGGEEGTVTAALRGLQWHGRRRGYSDRRCERYSDRATEAQRRRRVGRAWQVGRKDRRWHGVGCALG